MTSDKQIAANRRNAKRSTGPRTEQGKAAAAANATRHGLRSRDVGLEDEDGRLFMDMQVELCFQLQVEGEMETFLVRRIAAGMWRLQRLLRVEAGLFEEPLGLFADKSKGLGQRFRAQTQSGANAFATLQRYEASIERGISRALGDLQRLQAARRGKEGMPPMELEALLSAAGRS